MVQSLGTIKVHPSAHRLADAIGHVLTQLDPSSAHLKAGSTCTQKAVVPASGKDMASADKHQGSRSSKPVGADSLEQQDEEEELFELNPLAYN